MHWKCLLLTVLGVSYEVSATFHQEAPLLLTATHKYDCTGIMNTSHTDKYVCGNKSLGPTDLPKKFPLLSVLFDYEDHRLGNRTPADFFKNWTYHGFYTYPPHDGFLLDINGLPIMGNMTLTKGMKVDRFGKETGHYVSAAEAPFSQRALPPSSLDTDGDYPYDYHIYIVNHTFTVIGGPIAPWYDQPGLGAQYFLGETETIKSLKAKSWLIETNLTDFHDPCKQ